MCLQIYSCSSKTSSETRIDNNLDLDEDQIIELLSDITEENTNCLDNDYEQTENILNEIQSFQNIAGDSSIFTGKLKIKIFFYKNMKIMFRKTKNNY